MSWPHCGKAKLRPYSYILLAQEKSPFSSLAHSISATLDY